MVTNNTAARPLFSLGRIVATPGALEALAQAGQSPAEFIRRHVCGDFGTVDREDWQANEQAIRCGERVLSAYLTGCQARLWLITESDRTVTTLLLPEEY